VLRFCGIDLERTNQNYIRKDYIMLFLEIISWMIILVSGIYFFREFQIKTYDMETGKVVRVLEKSRYTFFYWIGTKE
jgi:hypothetical protein